MFKYFKYVVVMSVVAMMGAQACFAGTAGETGEGESMARHAPWINLFNGKDLTGWMSPEGKDYAGLASSSEGTGWVVENGVLARKDKCGNIWTKQRFSDFILDLELNTTGNSGILFRCDNPKDFVQTGMEMQVEKTGGPGNNKGLGAIYDCLAPSKEVGGDGWHHVTLTCKDNKIGIVIDGQQVIDMDVNKWDMPEKNPDGSKNKFKKALKDFKREGHIGLQDHKNPVQYRNIKIKILK